MQLNQLTTAEDCDKEYSRLATHLGDLYFKSELMKADMQELAGQMRKVAVLADDFRKQPTKPVIEVVQDIPQVVS